MKTLLTSFLLLFVIALQAQRPTAADLLKMAYCKDLNCVDSILSLNRPGYYPKVYKGDKILSDGYEIEKETKGFLFSFIEHGKDDILQQDFIALGFKLQSDTLSGYYKHKTRQLYFAGINFGNYLSNKYPGVLLTISIFELRTPAIHSYEYLEYGGGSHVIDERTLFTLSLIEPKKE